MKTIKDVRYGKAEEAKLDIYLPEGEIKSLFLYFHGGGLEAGDKRDAEVFAEDVCAKGIAIASANYRMYPAARFPDFLRDGAEAAAFLKKEYPALPLVIGGSSAGGYMSMMLCFDGTYLTQAGISPDDVAGYIHDAGQPTTHFNVLRERGLDTRRVIVDEAAPLWHIGLAKEYRPMYIIWSDRDMENRPEQSCLLLSTMRHFGYDMMKVFTRVMKGSHCAYVGRIDRDGHSAMAKLILEAYRDLGIS